MTLLEQLRILRSELAQLIEQGVPLTDERVLEISRELDRVVVALINGATVTDRYSPNIADNHGDPCQDQTC